MKSSGVAAYPDDRSDRAVAQVPGEPADEGVLVGLGPGVVGQELVDPLNEPRRTGQHAAVLAEGRRLTDLGQLEVFGVEPIEQHQDGEVFRHLDLHDAGIIAFGRRQARLQDGAVGRCVRRRRQEGVDIIRQQPRTKPQFFQHLNLRNETPTRPMRMEE